MDSTPSPHLESLSFLNSHSNLSVPLPALSSVYLVLHLVLYSVYLLVNCKPFQGMGFLLLFALLCSLMLCHSQQIRL